MTLVHRPQNRSQAIAEPPIEICSADHQRKEWLEKKNQEKLADFTILAIAGTLLSITLIKPLNAITEGGWRLTQLPNMDNFYTSVQTSFKADEPFQKTLKKGDNVLGYEVTSAFGPRKAPIAGASTFHNGIDIATPIGTPLYVPVTPAPKSSIQGFADVACNDWDQEAGKTAYITSAQFPDIELVVMHLSECFTGRVNAGGEFAKTGNSGNSEGPHAHIEMRIIGDWKTLNFKSDKVDPYSGFIRWMIEGKEPQPTVSNKPIVEKLRNAIAGQESNHDSSAVNPHSNALGYGQVMPENIKEWSTQCLGSPLTEDEFIKSKEKQVKIIDCKLTEYLKETAASSKDDDEQIRKVASMWYSGDPTLFDNPKPQKYGAGDYPSIRDYTTTVLERFKKH